MKDYYNSGLHRPSHDDILDYDATYDDTMGEYLHEKTSPNKSEFRDVSEQAQLLDRDIFRQTFMMPDDLAEDEEAVISKTWSSANSKFTDTTLGGNYGINSRPQFTMYSDIPAKGAIAGRNEVTLGDTSGDYGMGRFYSEAIDDPSHTIFMRFGTPEYNGLFSFMMSAVIPSDVSLVKSTRFSRAYASAYTATKIVSSIYAFAAFPAFFVLAHSATVLGSIFGRGVKRYYYFRPSMPLYWSSVNHLVNHVAINLNMLPKTNQGRGKGMTIAPDEDHLKALFDSTYGITVGNIMGSHLVYDMYAIANRAQRLHNVRQEEEREALEAGGTLDRYYVKGSGGYMPPTVNQIPGLSSLQNIVEGAYSAVKDYFITDETDPGKVASAAQNYVVEQKGDVIDEKDTSIATEIITQEATDLADNPKPDPDKANVAHTGPKQWVEEFVKFIDAERRDGSDFVTFKVDFPGSVSESFSNQTGDPPIKSAMNGASRAGKGLMSSIAGGNTGIDFLDDTVKTVTGWAAGGVAGTASGLTFGASDIVTNLASTLMGDAYMDIPQIWEDSVANMPSADYKMTLISPYNNPLSLMQNIYIPLCMILAGALPRSTGKSSYGSPFLCQVFDRGRVNIQLGLIESINITRGVSNLPFDLYGKPLAVDVSFTVKNLSSIMHYAMNSGSIFDSTANISEDSPMGEYLATISGMSITSMIYPVPRGMLRMQRMLINSNRISSPAFWANNMMDMPGFGLLKALSPSQLSYLEGHR